LYQAVTSALTEDDMLAMAAELEGHPDNAAACLMGGLTVSCRCEDGRIIARPSPWPARLQFVVATPDLALATKEARAVLPAAVPLADAVFNLQRALLLVRAVENERYLDLKEALRDRWHQPTRSRLVPGLREALALDDPAVLGVCLSGSGPSIAALAVPGREQEAAAALSGIYRRLSLPVTIRVLAAHQPIAVAALDVIERENTA
jgi:homoserine kinase